jgi:cytochrome c oxidase assembly protein subunit 15
MASIFHAFPQLRSAAPRLSRRLFVCRPCLNAPIRSAVVASRSSAPRPSVAQSVRWSSTQPLRSSATLTASPAHAAALAGAAKGHARSSSFPKTSSKSVAYWLLGSAASVFGIVIFGGLTRLTESG